MFESLVAGLLEKYVGAYVQNFDSKNLNIGYGSRVNILPKAEILKLARLVDLRAHRLFAYRVFSGKIVLRNLLLKPEALDFLDLPIAVRAGYIGTRCLFRGFKYQVYQRYYSHVRFIYDRRTHN